MKAIDFSGKKDIPFLLWAESFHYVLATIAVTLTIGTALGYVLCRTFSQIGLLGKLNYTFPLLPNPDKPEKFFCISSTFQVQ